MKIECTISITVLVLLNITLRTINATLEKKVAYTCGPDSDAREKVSQTKMGRPRPNPEDDDASLLSTAQIA